MKILKIFIPRKGESKEKTVNKIVLTVAFILLIGCGIFFAIFTRCGITPPPDGDTTGLSGLYEDPRLKYPNIVFPDGLLDEFVDLYARNHDFAGWLRIEGLERSLATWVVRGDIMENGQHEYLKKDFYGKKSRYGTPFIDIVCNADVLDDNTTIHGHNMNDGNLFNILEDYIKVDAFKQNPIIYYSTRYANYKFKVFAVYLTNPDPVEDNGYLFYYPKANFDSEESFNGYIKMIEQKTLYHTGVDVKYGDKLLTLSTCYDVYNNLNETARLVVAARMVRDNESDDVDFSKIVINENPRYYQRWYDYKGQSNPFRDTERWHP